MLYDDISTHTPLAGRDITGASSRLSIPQFLLTRPSRGVTNEERSLFSRKSISTHTPLAGRDIPRLPFTKIKKDFYSHAPRGA